MGIPSLYQELVALYDLHSQTLVSSGFLSERRALYTMVILVHQAQITLAEKSESFKNVEQSDKTAIFKKANKLLH